jgi:hypothetical protein
VSVRVVPPEEVAQQASCVLQIEADAAYNPYGGGTAAIDARTAASILRSTPVLEAAVKQTPGAGGLGRRIQDWLVVNAVPTGQRFLEVEVILLKGDPGNEMDDKRAAKILSSLCKALEGALRESADGQRQHPRGGAVPVAFHRCRASGFRHGAGMKITNDCLHPAVAGLE